MFLLVYMSFVVISIPGASHPGARHNPVWYTVQIFLFSSKLTRGRLSNDWDQV